MCQSITGDKRTMTLKIVKLQGEHLDDAAALVSARCAGLRAQAPSLPSRYEDTGVVFSLLRDLAGTVPGVAALRRSRLVGFLLGFVIPVFRGKRTVFSPEWANAAELADSRRIYEEMYALLSDRWIANGCFTHLVSSLAHDGAAMDGWSWLGFGLIAVDAVRALEPAQGPVADVEVRRARLAEIESALAMGEALERHMAAAPTFLAYTEKDDRAFHEGWLADQANALWLAYDGGRAVACLGQGPANSEACDIIQDEKTTSIVRAFTGESVRGQGIATALLNRSLEWARSQGYERCAVDFEPMNLLAARFWMRHFEPICYTLVRHVDERISWAHAQRDHKHLW
jgi:GNAT superfamily N-acetyltransferase